VAVPGLNAGNTTLFPHSDPTTSARADHALAQRQHLWAWGGNDSGQLGNGTTDKTPKPLRSGTDNTWKAVAAGWYFSLGIKTDGTLWAWGQNYYGQLGDGSNTNRTVPVRVGQDTDWASVAAGQSHTLAIKTDGTLWAWGHNNGGQLGDGSKANKNKPLQIGTDADWIQVAAGSTHSAAVKRDGSIWTWGSNYYSQLGTSPGESLRPTREEGSIAAWVPLKSGMTGVSAGSTFTTASLERAVGLGNNSYGRSPGDRKALLHYKYTFVVSTLSDSILPAISGNALFGGIRTGGGEGPSCRTRPCMAKTRWVAFQAVRLFFARRPRYPLAGAGKRNATALLNQNREVLSLADNDTARRWTTAGKGFCDFRTARRLRW
jgi:hypothetical protein